MTATEEDITAGLIPDRIHVLMSRVMADVGAIPKSRQTSQGGGASYKFRGIDEVMNKLQDVLVKHGVFFTPDVLEYDHERYTTKSGTGMISAKFKIRFTFYGPGGDRVSATVIGEAADSGDKASNKAMSIGMKYALLQVFCIPTEEMGEEDPDARVIEGHATEERPKKASSGAGIPSYVQQIIAAGVTQGKVVAAGRKVVKEEGSDIVVESPADLEKLTPEMRVALIERLGVDIQIEGTPKGSEEDINARWGAAEGEPDAG